MSILSLNHRACCPHNADLSQVEIKSYLYIYIHSVQHIWRQNSLTHLPKLRSFNGSSSLTNSSLKNHRGLGVRCDFFHPDLTLITWAMYWYSCFCLDSASDWRLGIRLCPQKKRPPKSCIKSYKSV